MTIEPRIDELPDAMISVAAHLESELEEALAEYQLTRGTFLVLLALSEAEGGALNQGELVAKVRRTSGTMSVRLRRLEHAGVIERAREAENRRSVTVKLTGRGLELVQAARPAYRERCERLTSALTAGGRSDLARRIPEWLAFFEPGERSAPRLGVAVAPAAVAARMRRAVGLTAEPGVLILRVQRDSAAHRAGLAHGDLVFEAGGQPIRSIGDLDRAIRAAKKEISVKVLRGASRQDLEVSLA